MESDTKISELIKKRDNLMKQNLNKELKKTWMNLKKNSEDGLNVSENYLRKPSFKLVKEIVPSTSKKEIVDEKIEIPEEKFQHINNEIPKKEFVVGILPTKSPVRDKLSLPFEKEEILESKMPIEEPEEKEFVPKRKILDREMEINMKVLEEENARMKKNFFSLDKKKESSDKIHKQIIKNSEAHISELSGEVDSIAEDILKIKKEVAKAVVGQEDVINTFICALLCDGHVLLEGVPGIAKTLIVKTLAEASGCSSGRIQFTVDLLPSDILGITTYTPQKGFETIKGPIFANFIVADEINRSPPKTQSAMIEAMQEKQVTIGKQTFPLPLPFFIMANNNPLEQSGVYDLPEAQIDRFLFKVLIGYPNNEDEIKIMEDNMTIKKFESFDVQPVLSPNKILHMQQITKKIYVDKRVKEYIVKIIDKTRKKDFEHGQYIEWGGSPRASIGLFIASKAWALMNGRAYVIPKDVKDIAHHVLRHRIILNYRARAEKLDSDKIIDEILNMVEV